ncbi:MAG: glycosyltransferase [Candidatus Aerophobus sp.]|nr:MAG: glycosyltransferase [Candidatus Aerophobus sp.]
MAYRFPQESASRVLTQRQRIFLLSLASIFVIWFIFDYPSSFLVLFALINLFYFVTNPVKLYVAVQGFGRGKVINVTKEEIESIKDEELPLYTIFIPLYKEAESLPQVLSNIAQLDYPRDKLDVKIILEEGDEETIQAAKKVGLVAGEVKGGEGESKATNLQGKSFEAIIVPRADIKTKPRACNFALKRASGEFCVIYDAEDNPDPDQLKKVVCAFRQLEKEYICLQAKLNYYNPTQNMLTKWFTLEYHFWFDYYLPGLVGINAPLPLGGTSNHFRTEALREIGGWDPYNVTEDADLGMRIHRHQLKTAVIDSYTLEEANSKLWNWIRQRSRWQKGYAQTFLVYMRYPLRLLREIGVRSFLLFQLTFGGNFYLPLINPLLWLVTVATFMFKGAFSFLFLYPIPILCLFNLVVGNSIYIIIHLYAAIRTRKYFLIPYAILIPLYWVLMSIGCWKGTIQLITRPFYWEKTVHAIYKAK